MDLTQIRHFLALAKTLNFTRAAELCHVTQPALTKSIRRLETELGGPLLLRERVHTQLTELGAAILPHLQQSFDAAEAARASARHLRQRGRQRLRLALGAGVEPTIVLPLILEVRRHFPQVELTVRDGESAQLNGWLLGSEVDLAVTMHPAALTERANRWTMFTDAVVAVTPANAADTSPLAAEALPGAEIVGGFDETARGIEAQYPLGEAVRHRGASEAQMHMLVRLGAGIGLSTARRVVPPDLVHRTIVPRHTMPVCITALAGRLLSPAADTFLRLARATDWGDGPCPLP